RRDPKAAQHISKRSPEELEARKSEAVEFAVATFEALIFERGDSSKIWASMLKEAIKRRKPDFNESYYGFRSFGNLLEEAQSRGLLELGRDEKSGAFVSRCSTPLVASAPVVTDEKSAAPLPKRRGRGGNKRSQKESPPAHVVQEATATAAVSGAVVAEVVEAAPEKKPARSRRARKPKTSSEVAS
ncbi:MAG: OST-HTH/LOTUS domain-containing protein, partial [Betaproteobacteria bacterium]